ncbi:MAG: PilZ domain-containing protein [Phycisphaerales bacterium JB052]
MDSGLIVRRSVRFEIAMPARIRVAPHHAEILNFSKGVCDEDRWIEVDVIDFAAGGLGFIIDVFLPRNVDLEIEVFDFHDKTNPPLLTSTLRVQRVLMTDRRPAYQIGCSFTDQNDESKAQVESLIEKLSGISDDAKTGGHHA